MIQAFLRLKLRQQAMIAAAFMAIGIGGLHFIALPRVVETGALVNGKFVQAKAGRKFMPIRKNARLSKKYITLAALVDYQPWQQSTFRFLPEGCINRIMVNGHEIDVSHYRNNCSMIHGFRLNLKPYLNSGKNHLIFFMQKSGYTAGVHFYPLVMHYNFFSVTYGLIFFAGYLLLWLVLLRRAGLDPRACAIAVAGLAFVAMSLWGFKYTTFALDWTGHLDYVLRISELEGGWPHPSKGWQYYHPPVYYMVGALFHAIFNEMGTIDPIAAVRFVSFMCFTVFLYYGALTLRLLLKDDRAFYVALTLFCFWPFSPLLSGRIESHLMFYALYALFGYLLVRGFQQKNQRDYLLAALVAAAAFGGRSNAYIMGVIWMCLLPYFMRHSGGLKSFFNQCLRQRLCYVIVLVAIVAAGINLGRNAYFASDNPLIVANYWGNSPLTRIHKYNVLGYVLPDVFSYFETPIWEFYSNRGGRQYFWNVLIKSSFYEHYRMRWILFQQIMIVIGGLVWCAIFYQQYRVIKTRAPDRLLLGSMMIVPLVMMLIHRYLHPIAASQDFRYVFPMIIVMSALFGRGVQTARETGNARYEQAYIVAMLVMVVTTILMYFSQWYITRRFVAAFFS